MTAGRAFCVFVLCVSQDDVQCLSSESATLRRGHVTTQGADSKATGATEGFPVSSDWQSRVEALERTIELMREVRGCVVSVYQHDALGPWGMFAGSALVLYSAPSCWLVIV